MVEKLGMAPGSVYYSYSYRSGVEEMITLI
jgi:hypothetical protein